MPLVRPQPNTNVMLGILKQLSGVVQSVGGQTMYVNLALRGQAFINPSGAILASA